MSALARAAHIALLAIAAGASLVAAPARAQAAGAVTVFAAASLKNALDEVAKGWEAQTPGRKVLLSYAASSALARQIEAGAPADLFISADLDWMEYLKKRDLINPGTRQNLLRNRLVLIAPAGSRVTLKIGPRFPLAGTLGKERLAMGDPASVPAGRYGKAALEFLGVWSEVQARVAPAADVRAALLLVARGEAPLGIVYGTDAAAGKAVRVVDEFPANSHPPIVYSAAMTRSGRGAGAGVLLKYLGEAEARAVFAKHGFR